METKPKRPTPTQMMEERREAAALLKKKVRALGTGGIARVASALGYGEEYGQATVLAWTRGLSLPPFAKCQVIRDALETLAGKRA